MSAYSDWKSGAISYTEFLSSVRRDEAMQEHLERRREVVSDITSAVDKAIEEHGYFVDNVLPTKDGFIIRITESEE